MLKSLQEYKFASFRQFQKEFSSLTKEHRVFGATTYALKQNVTQVKNVDFRLQLFGLSCMYVHVSCKRSP